MTFDQQVIIEQTRNSMFRYTLDPQLRNIEMKTPTDAGLSIYDRAIRGRDLLLHPERQAGIVSASERGVGYTFPGEMTATCIVSTPLDEDGHPICKRIFPFDEEFRFDAIEPVAFWGEITCDAVFFLSLSPQGEYQMLYSVEENESSPHSNSELNAIRQSVGKWGALFATEGSGDCMFAPFAPATSIQPVTASVYDFYYQTMADYMIGSVWDDVCLAMLDGHDSIPHL